MKKIFVPLILSLLLAMIMTGQGCEALAAQNDFNSLVVKMKPGLTATEQAAVIARDGGTETSSIPALRMHIIAIPSDQDLLQILQNYQADPQVERAELNKERQAEAQPNDANYGVQWALPKIGWESVFGGGFSPSSTVVKVAVLDTGVDAAHPDLGDNVVLPGFSLLDATDGRSDSNGHGTWLAGIIAAASNNQQGIAGVCTAGVKVLPVKVLNGDGIGKDGDIIAGIARAVESGAKVILMGFSNTDFSQNLQDAIDYAWENGAVLVAAAGNAGVDIPAFPAGNRGVIGVSATNQNDILAAESNYGQSVFLAAPGESIYTTNPGNEPYTYISGTSASSAIVAGVAAFMKAVDPTLTNGVIVGRLATSADEVGTPGDSGNRLMYGNGRINMAAALASTATDSIQPAGAAPVGAGGPYVGPYVTATSFQVHASFSANTSTISASGSGVNANWIYQYAYQSPTGLVIYHPCTLGSAFSSDTLTLTSGYETGTWKVYLYAYNPSYQTCLNNGSATKSDMTTTDVSVTTAYMSVSPTSGTYGGTVTLSASLTIGTPLVGKTISFALNGVSVGSAVTNSSGVATLSNVSLGTIGAGSYPTGIGASFAGDGVYLPASAAGSLTVAKATPTVTSWPTASSINYLEALSASTLSGGSATAAGTFSFTAPGTMPVAGTYNAEVVFTPGDGANFTNVLGNVNVTVNKLTPSVTWPTATGITYGQALSASTLNGGSASVGGTFAFADTTVTPPSGTYSAAVVFSPGDPNYNAIPGSVAVAVSKATPAVTAWPTATGITYPQPLSTSTLTGGSASVGGLFSFVTLTTVPAAGKYAAAAVFRPTDGNYNEVAGTVDVNVAHGTPSVSAWPTASQLSYTQPLSASTLSGGTSSVPGSFAFANPEATPVSGTYSAAVTFTPNDSSYTMVSGTVDVTVNKVTPTVTAWPTASTLTYGQNLSSSPLSGGAASVPGTFSFAAPETVLTAGTHSVAVLFTATDPNYNTVSGSISIGVNKATPTVTSWPAASRITYGQQLSAASLSGGTASVAGTFAYATPTALLDSGSHTVVVTFTAADPNYNIVSGSVPVIVDRATPSVMVWPSLTAINYGQPVSASLLSGGSASVDGIFSFATPTVVPNAGNYPAEMVFTPISGNYTTVSGSVNLTVNKLTPTITAWPAAGALTYGQPVSASILSGGSASVPGTFSFTAPSTVPPAGAYTAGLLFTPDSGNYTTVSGSVELAVAKAVPTVTAWPEASSLVYGQALSSSSLSGGLASVPGTFSFSVPGTVPAAGTYTAVVVFTPGDGANFQGVSGFASVAVSPAPQVINFGALSATSFSLTPIVLTATATSGLPISFNTLTPAVCSVSGDTVSLVGVGTCTIEASQSGNGNYYPAAMVAQSFLVNPGELDHFAVSSSSDPQTVGVPFSVTITAQDAWNHTVTGFTGTVTLSTTAGTITPAVSSSLIDGVWTGDVMVTGAGSGKTISVAAGPKTGTGSPFDVKPGDAVAFTVTAPAIAFAGQAFDISVIARDSFNNTATSYTGTVHFTSTDGRSGVSLPADFSFGVEDGGTRTFAGVLLETAGTQTISAVDMANSSLAGVSGSIAVSPSDVAKLAISAPATATAGTAFPVTVSVRDAYDNTISGYTGTISFTGSDPNGMVPTPYTFVPDDNGSHTFVGATTFKTSGIQTLSAADVSTPGVSGTSGSISVNSAAASILAFIQQPSRSMPAEPISPSVAISVKDQYGNLVTGSMFDVTLALATGSHSGTLLGTLTRSTVNGIASFPDLALAAEGNGYMLNATSGSLPPVNSIFFDIIKGTCGNPGSLTVPSTNITGSIPVSWGATNVSNATYVLEQSKDGSAFTQVYSGLATSASITVSSSGTYTYRIKATKDGYNSSAYVAGSNGCVVRLTCPAPLSVNVPATNSSGTIMVTVDPGGFSGGTYIVEMSKEGAAFTQVASGTSSPIAVTVTENGTYTFRVKTVKAGYFDSGFTAVSAGCAVRLACSAPALLSVPPKNSTGMVYISWYRSDVNGATYLLEQSQDGGPFTQVYSGTNTYATVSVASNGTYTYRIKATKAGYDPSDYTAGTNGCAVHLACGAPDSLTIPASNSTGVLWISWGASDVNGATYVLEQSQDGGAFTVVYSGQGLSTYVTVTANGTYRYQVKAIKTNYDPSPYTAGNTGCAVHLACGAPASLTVPTNNSTGVVWVTWGASDVNGVTYVLEQSQDGGPFTVVYSGQSLATNVTVSANGTYTYQVKATKANYDTSPYTSGNTGCAVHLACGAPASLAVPATNSTGVLWITWGGSDVAGVTYVLEQSQDGGPFKVVYSGQSLAANVTVTANGTYRYQIKATKANYDTSPYTSGNTGCAVHLACGAPAPLTVPATNSTGALWISWGASDVAGATYILEQSQDGGGYTEVYSGSGTAANVLVTANGTYTYRVKAMKANYDTSPYTSGNTGSTVHLACGAPTSLTVPGTSSTGVLWISWRASDVAGVTYVLEQSQDGGPFTVVYSGQSLSTYVTVTANGTYRYQIKAIKTNYDPSPYAPGNAACAVHLACGAPVSLTVPANSTGLVWITWGTSDVAGVTYVLEQSQDGGVFTEVYSGSGTAANVTVAANGTYAYRVKATKANYDTSAYTAGNTTCAVSLACGAPGSISVPSGNNTGTIWISWTASDISGVTYVVEQSQDGGAFTQVYSGSSLAANITVSSNGTYVYRVRAQRDGYAPSAWTSGGTACTVMLYSNVRLRVAGNSDKFFSTLSAAISGISSGTSATLTSWVTTFVEDINLDKVDCILTIGSAFDKAYSAAAGPTVIKGTMTVTAGTLIADNVVIR